MLAVVALATAVPGTAAAHTDLEASSPEAGSVLPQRPEAVVLEMGGTVLSASVDVTDGCGRAVPTATIVDGASVRAALDASGSGGGDWVARWVAVGEDGHEIGGTIPFTVDGAVECAADATTSGVAAASAQDEPPAAQPSPADGGLPTGALLAVGAVLLAGAGAVVAQRAGRRPGSAGPTR